MKKKVFFTVPGKASPSGSKKAFAHPKTGRIIVMDTAKGKDSWQSRVSMFATLAISNNAKLTAEEFAGPVSMTIQFYFSRPKSHYRTGKNSQLLKADAPQNHIQKCDLTKLVRCTEDALTGIAFKDDCQVIERLESKGWADEDAVKILLVWGS